MDPGSVPDQLKGLIQAEEMLIAKSCSVMRVYRLKGGQRGYGGHIVNLAQNIGDFTSGDDDLDSERDTGPEQDGASGGDEDTESFLRSVVGAGAGSRSQTAATAVPWPEMEDTPLNEFKTQGLYTLCFPALFPCGRGDPTHVARRQKVTNAEGFKHLLRYYD
ncbi:unnamed protein product, partial [Ascophyllum nodosum]